jgi:hypothetical protein
LNVQKNLRKSRCSSSKNQENQPKNLSEIFIEKIIIKFECCRKI